MITCVTVGYTHGAGKAPKAQVILGPEAHPDEHIKQFKKLCASRSHEKFETVQVISSNSGMIRTVRFITPDQEKSRHAGTVAKARLVSSQSGTEPAKPDAPASSGRKAKREE